MQDKRYTVASKEVTSRLKRIAELQDLAEKNMPINLVNQLLQEKESGVAAEDVVYRRLMNSNTRFVVEIWTLSDGKFAVLSGHFEGQWNPGNLDLNEIAESKTEAELFVQENLQNQAEMKEVVVGKKKA